MTADIASPPPRLASIDAYRGLVMFLMMAEVLSLAIVAANHPGSFFWAFLADHQTHVEWVGCSLHDMIQPSFSFLVGVALPFSLASRRRRGPVAPAPCSATRPGARSCWSPSASSSARSAGRRRTSRSRTR